MVTPWLVAHKNTTNNKPMAHKTKIRDNSISLEDNLDMPNNVEFTLIKWGLIMPIGSSLTYNLMSNKKWTWGNTLSHE